MIIGVGNYKSAPMHERHGEVLMHDHVCMS